MDEMDLGTQDFNLEDMDEETLQKLVELGVINEEMAENQRQMKLAEQLRYSSSPEGRQAGRVYVAASPLEHIGAGMQQWQAAKKMKELETQRGQMGGKQTAARQNYWDLLRGQRKVPLESLQGMKLQTPDLSGIQPPNPYEF